MSSVNGDHAASGNVQGWGIKHSNDDGASVPLLAVPNDEGRTGDDRWCCMRGRSSTISRPQRLFALMKTVANVANAAVGSGVLAFPFAYSQSGFVLGIVITLVCGALLTISLMVLTKAARLYEVTTYQDLAFAMYGKVGKRVLLINQILYTFFTGVAYLIVLSTMIQPLVHSNVDKTTIRSIVIACAGVGILPLTLMRSIDKLGFTSLVGIAAMLFTCTVVWYYGTTEPLDDPSIGNAEPFHWKFSAFQTVPIVDFSLMCHLTVIPAAAGLQPFWPSRKRADATRLRALVGICISVIALCMVIYIPTGVLGYKIFGSQTQSNILDNFTPDYTGPTGGAEITVARVCVAICIFFSYPIPSFVGRQSVVSLLKWDVDGETGAPVEVPLMKHIILTVTFVLGATGTAVAATLAKFDLGFVISIIGATAAVVAQYILPGMMMMSMQRKRLGWAFVAIGIAMSVCGLFITISQYVCKDKGGSFCVTLGLGNTTVAPTSNYSVSFDL